MTFELTGLSTEELAESVEAVCATYGFYNIPPGSVLNDSQEEKMRFFLRYISKNIEDIRIEWKKNNVLASVVLDVKINNNVKIELL